MNTEAPTAAEFCRIIPGDKRLPGYWSGSAFRHHPQGIFRDRMIFTNEWNVNNYCSVKVMTDPDARLVLGCQESAAHGDPSPSASSGDLLAVYHNGQWIADGPWCEKIIKILEDVKRETAALRQSDREANEAQQREAKAAAQKRLAAAAAALS